MQDATELRPLPRSFDCPNWWQLDDITETGNIFILKIRGFQTALFNVRNVSLFMDYFGGKSDTTIVFIERSAVMWAAQAQRDRRTSMEDEVGHSQKPTSRDTTPMVSRSKAVCRCEDASGAIRNKRPWH